LDLQTQKVNIFDDTTNIGTVDTVRSTTITNPSCGLYNGFGIWYKIKPFTNTKYLSAYTCFTGGTNFDTVITVYEGDNCRPQFCVDQNNDNFPGLYLCSTVVFAVSSSATYWIFVDGNGGAAKGSFELTVGVSGG
jgi:hypothetical protein